MVNLSSRIVAFDCLMYVFIYEMDFKWHNWLLGPETTLWIAHFAFFSFLPGVLLYKPDSGPDTYQFTLTPGILLWDPEYWLFSAQYIFFSQNIDFLDQLGAVDCSFTLLFFPWGFVLRSFSIRALYMIVKSLKNLHI